MISTQGELKSQDDKRPEIQIIAVMVKNEWKSIDNGIQVLGPVQCQTT